MKRKSTGWMRLVWVVASLLFLEGLARLYLHAVAPSAIRQRFAVYADLPAADRRVTAHPYLAYVNTPGYRRGGRSHNSLGWRGAETSLEKAEGAYRILVLGGSSTYTEAVADDSKTFPALLQGRLREVHGFSQVEVINGGVPGYNSWETFVNLCFRGLEMSPDLVIVHHGANDVHCRFVRPGTYRADNRGRRKAWQWEDLSWLEENATLYRLFKRLGRGAHIGLEPFVDAPDLIGPYSSYADPELAFGRLLDAHSPVHYRNNLRHMGAVCADNGVAFLLTTWAWCPRFEKDYAGFAFYQRGFREMNAVVRDLASEREWACYDFASQMPQERRYWHDGRHVNEAGSALKARLFADYLSQSAFLQGTPPS